MVKVECCPQKWYYLCWLLRTSHRWCLNGWPSSRWSLNGGLLGCFRNVADNSRWLNSINSCNKLTNYTEFVNNWVCLCLCVEGWGGVGVRIGLHITLIPFKIPSTGQKLLSIQPAMGTHILFTTDPFPLFTHAVNTFASSTHIMDTYTPLLILPCYMDTFSLSTHNLDTFSIVHLYHGHLCTS